MSFGKPDVNMPEWEDPKIAEARRRRLLAEQRARGRGMSVLGGRGGAPSVSTPVLLGGGGGAR